MSSIWTFRRIFATSSPMRSWRECSSKRRRQLFVPTLFQHLTSLQETMVVSLTHILTSNAMEKSFVSATSTSLMNQTQTSMNNLSLRASFLELRLLKLSVGITIWSSGMNWLEPPLLISKIDSLALNGRRLKTSLLSIDSLSILQVKWAKVKWKCGLKLMTPVSRSSNSPKNGTSHQNL